MNHFQTERKAIYETATFFTKCGWIFREQPIVDLGIDAFVETPLDSNGQVKIFALQIKGGESNFYKREKNITFYFSQRHFLYWNAISENHPLLIILQDPTTDIIYWQHYSQKYISKTPKNWKLNIPSINILDEDAKGRILETLYSCQYLKTSPAPNTISRHTSFQPNKDNLNISYFLNSEVNNTLHISLQYKSEETFINLNYKPKKKEWDHDNSFLSWENAYYYSLTNFNEYLKIRFNETKRDKHSFKKIIEITNHISKGHVENIAEFMFDYNNQENNVPKYADFLKAFELYSKLKKGQYEATALDSIILFKTKRDVFEISTYESLTDHLKSYIRNASYDEIFTQTKEHIWGQLYIDAGIEKSKFIPIMQNEWESYWNELYKRIKEEIGHTDHLDKSKEESWRMFKSFIDLYDDAGNIIELAYDFDEMVLYPMAVITMMRIFDPEVCYGEYCEFEFDAGNEWESISINDENFDSPIFFIKPYEF